jgi:hypothetical protein
MDTLCILLVVPLVTALDALVKDGHGFVGRPDLHLHKVRLLVIASRTGRLGPIHVLPRRRAAQYVVDLFAYPGLFDRPRRGDLVHVVARGADEAILVGRGRNLLSERTATVKLDLYKRRRSVHPIHAYQQ